ncbi:MAG: hypothetical protein ACKO96_32745, partial [Flammeovirgaceae bacterium]
IKKMNFQIVKSELPANEFLKLLVDHFPEIKNEVLDPDYDGLIHLQVGGLYNYANKCVDTKRFDELKKIFDFFEATVTKVHTTVENAVYVSFLEHVDFKGLNEKEIKKYLNPDIYKTWAEIRK